MSAPVSLEIGDGVGWLTLDRPAAGNSLDLPALSGLLDAVRDAEAADLGVLVLRATGRRFCVGGDLVAFRAAEDRSGFIGELAAVLHEAVSRLTTMDAVTVAAVQGAAAGAGLSLAAACDVVVAAESATFTLAYTGVGLSPDGGVTASLTASLGLHRTMRLALLNAPLSATQAYELGLVAAVHPDGELAGEVATLADRLAAGPRQAQAAVKHLVRRAAGTDGMQTHLDLEAAAIIAAAGTDAAGARISAFVDRRN